MPDPSFLTVKVVDVRQQTVPGAQAAITVRKGTQILDQVPMGDVPRQVNLRPGFVQIEVQASAPHYFSEHGEVLYGVYDRWSGSNCDWKLTENADTVSLDVVLGRLRLAKVVSFGPRQQVPPDYTAPGIVLDERPLYRTFWPDAEKKMMILNRPAAKKPDGTEWKRIEHTPIKVNLGDSGNWLYLEYGDPDGDGLNVRFLIGVWAPHSVPFRIPAVVVQLTPNPSPKIGYPVDRFPFTGIYPFRMVPEAPPKPPATTVPISTMHQRYPDLALDRCLTNWYAVYQIYGARPDIFSGPNGPIVITIVPAATTKGVQRAPMSHRDGVGRLVAEILRFLWSRRLTLTNGTGRVRLLFPSTGPGDVTTADAGRPVGPLDGFPSQVTSTILTHSAGAGALAEIANTATRFPNDFPAELWGGCATYGDRDWKGIWLIDGVARDDDGNVMYQPAQGSDIVKLWKQWVRGADDRRFTAVCCEAALPASEENGLVLGVKRIYGSAGWIEEGQTPDKKIAWLRVSNSVLSRTDPTSYPGVIPVFGGRGKPHDDIFMIGIGYAARPAP